jgi:hypothetical protein
MWLLTRWIYLNSWQQFFQTVVVFQNVIYSSFRCSCWLCGQWTPFSHQSDHHRKAVIKSPSAMVLRPPSHIVSKDSFFLKWSRAGSVPPGCRGRWFWSFSGSSSRPVIWCWKTRHELRWYWRHRLLLWPVQAGGGGGGGGEGDSSRLSDGPTSDILNGLSSEKCINRKNCPVTATLDIHDVRDLRLHTSYLHTY